MVTDDVTATVITGMAGGITANGITVIAGIAAAGMAAGAWGGFSSTAIYGSSFSP